MVKVGILGVGTVGASVAKILEENADIIEARAGKQISVKSGVVKNLSKERGVKIKLSDNPLEGYLSSALCVTGSLQTI